MFKVISLLLLTALLMACSSKNERGVEAARQAIQLKAPQVSTKNFMIEPTALSVFFWPTEEFFQRYRKPSGTPPPRFYPIDGSQNKNAQQAKLRQQHLIEAVDYETYIAGIAEIVMREGDAFDGTLIAVDNKMKKGQVLENKITRLQNEIGKALSRQPVNEKKVASYRKELKKYEDLYEQHQQELVELYESIVVTQIKALGAIQAALDPQAVSYSDDGIDIDASRQVNWFPVYSDAADDANVFDFTDPKAPRIQLGEWGPDAQSYTTTYLSLKGAAGEVEARSLKVLAPDSEIYDVSLSPEGILKFKFMQKNSRGNLTGRRYEFELQLSYLASMLRLMGDVRLMYQDTVLRQGQFKALFLPDY